MTQVDNYQVRTLAQMTVNAIDKKEYGTAQTFWKLCENHILRALEASNIKPNNLGLSS